MNISAIAGFAVITQDPDASAAFYQNTLALPLKTQGDYRFVHGFPGSHHFGVWPLTAAAQACFGVDEWPTELPIPQTTLEFEFTSVTEVEAAVAEMQESGHSFIHPVRQEPWGQTMARLLSPEGVLIGLSFAPWLHDSDDSNP